MKSIMYHYVRPDDPELPFFRHLHIEDFVKQLDFFEREYGFVSRQGFRESLRSKTPAEGVILTFDDGFKDHFRYVMPELLRRELWGIFYITVSPLTAGKLIDVHRIHMLIGKYGGEAMADHIRGLVSDEMLSHDHVDEFHSKTYSRQVNDESTRYVKRLLNYFIDYKYRGMIIDRLMVELFPRESELVEVST